MPKVKVVKAESKQTPPASKEGLSYVESSKSVATRSDSFQDEIQRKTLQNPFVPLGLLVTVGALTFGIYSMRTGNREMSQKMMRLRVGAQLFTVLSIVGGVWYQAGKQHRK